MAVHSNTLLQWEINMHIHGGICWTLITDNCFREYDCQAGLKGCEETIADGMHAEKQMFHSAKRQIYLYKYNKELLEKWFGWELQHHVRLFHSFTANVHLTGLGLVFPCCYIGFISSPFTV